MKVLTVTLLLTCVYSSLAQYGNDSPLPGRIQIPGAIALGPKAGSFRQGRVLQQQQALPGPGPVPRVRRPGQVRSGSFKSAPSPTPYLQVLEESPKPVTEEPEDVPEIQSTIQSFPSSAAPFNPPSQLAQDDLPQLFLSPSPSPSKPPPNYPSAFPSPAAPPRIPSEPIRLPQPTRPPPSNFPSPSPIKYEAPVRQQQPVRLAPLSYRPPRPQFRPETRPLIDDDEESEQPIRQQVFRQPPQRPHAQPAQPAQHAQPARYASSDRRDKKPVAQVIRKYRDDNPDGSITWGFENDDGSFKEETIGIDCVTRGRYGYVDPDGLKREYSYETGIFCDKTKKDQEEQGFVDYQGNKAVLPNGVVLDLAAMGKKSRRPNRQVAQQGKI